MSVITVENIGKQYRVGADASGMLRDRIADALRNPVAAFRRKPRETFWALRDVSFEVQEGEVLGLIGRNGAGKSTLLKVLSRITKPTVGHAEIHGRVGSLLEVGTGFHPELSGRENVFLNGAVLGMGRREITRKFDEIVTFAEVEKFIDTPVKFYSSGMYIRLAFAVAAHLETEILFVDEVLSVGDVSFQKKCLGKMGDVAAQGRTVVFVSHNMATVTRLCHRAMLLAGGQVVFDGDVRSAISRYLPVAAEDGEICYVARERITGPHVGSARVETSSGNGDHDYGTPIAFEFDIEVPEPCTGLCFSFQVINEDSIPICHFWLLNSDSPFGAKAGVQTLRCEVPRPRIYMGTYTLATSLADRRGVGKHLERLEGICKFKVNMLDKHRDQYDWERGTCTYLEDGTWSVRPDNDKIRRQDDDRNNVSIA